MPCSALLTASPDGCDSHQVFGRGHVSGRFAVQRLREVAGVSTPSHAKISDLHKQLSCIHSVQRMELIGQGVLM